MNRPLSVLIAEDDENDVFLLQRAFKKAELTNPTTFVADGLACIEALTQVRMQPEERLPGLVLLDLKMPRRSGLQVLEWMRAEPVMRSIPAVIFSSSANQTDVEAAYEAGANAYLIKPPSTDERVELAVLLKQWLRLIQPPLAAGESFKAALNFRSIHPGASGPG